MHGTFKFLWWLTACQFNSAPTVKQETSVKTENDAQRPTPVNLNRKPTTLSPIALDRKAAPNIVLITIDTLRADHLKVYGYKRQTAPAISALAAKGVTFLDAVAPAPWTLPTLASIHSSLYPSEHHVVGAQTRLSESVETLAETLKRAGYTTLGVVSNRFASFDYGMSQGFDFFDDSQIVGHHDLSSPGLTRVALNAVENLDDGPFFLWVHYFDPHFTFVRHPEFGFADGYTGRFGDKISNADVRAAFSNGGVSDQDIAYVRNVYDEEIAFTDQWIGELLNSPTLKTERNQVTILTADHGEYFMERGRFFHGEDVYKELIHVPLIIAGDIAPHLVGTTVNDTVSLISIPKTLMNHLGVSEHSFRGIDLLNTENTSTKQSVFAEGSHLWGRGNQNKSVVTPHWKLILTPATGAFELYDRKADPNERQNQFDDELPAEVQQLQKELLAFPTLNGPQPGLVHTDPETLRQLEALGYVE